MHQTYGLQWHATDPAPKEVRPTFLVPFVAVVLVVLVRPKPRCADHRDAAAALGAVGVAVGHLSFLSFLQSLCDDSLWAVRAAVPCVAFSHHHVAANDVFPGHTPLLGAVVQLVVHASSFLHGRGRTVGAVVAVV